MENAKYAPDKNCVSCSRHKITWKLACLCVEKTSLIQKQKPSGKLPILVYENFVSHSKTLLSGMLPLLRLENFMSLK